MLEEVVIIDGVLTRKRAGYGTEAFIRDAQGRFGLDPVRSKALGPTFSEIGPNRTDQMSWQDRTDLRPTTSKLGPTEPDWACNEAGPRPIGPMYT